MQAALRERYALLPYIYTLFRAANATGAPIMRPLWYEFPDQADLFAEQHAYMLGSALLVAPVLEKGAAQLRVAFPQATRWYGAADGEQLTLPASGHTTLDVTPESMPRCVFCMLCVRGLSAEWCMPSCVIGGAAPFAWHDALPAPYAARAAGFTAVAISWRGASGRGAARARSVMTPSRSSLRLTTPAPPPAPFISTTAARSHSSRARTLRRTSHSPT